MSLENSSVFGVSIGSFDWKRNISGEFGLSYPSGKRLLRFEDF
jgi:hypothetical protein